MNKFINLGKFPKKVWIFDLSYDIIMVASVCVDAARGRTATPMHKTKIFI